MKKSSSKTKLSLKPDTWLTISKNIEITSTKQQAKSILHSQAIKLSMAVIASDINYKTSHVVVLLDSGATMTEVHP